MSLATSPTPDPQIPQMRRPPATPDLSGLSSAPSVHDAIKASYETLESIRLANGLYLASPSADYSKVWLRDSVYEVMPYVDKATDHYERTLWSLLDIHRRHEFKIDAMIRQKPHHRDDYIHARFHPETLREFDEPWGNKQNDATGAVLFAVAQGIKHGKNVLRDDRDRRLLGKMVRMLESLQYWDDADNGMWEENEEVHSSSIGACVGALTALRELGFDVPRHVIDQGRRALDALLPRESDTKPMDLAQLSLVFPYRVATREQARSIVRNVEKRLVRARGVVRYEGDSYYSMLADEHGRDQPWEFYHGSEAEWTFGLPWLSLCHRELGDLERSRFYLDWSRAVMIEGGKLPELYFAGTDEPNPNTPLGWSNAMFILAAEAELNGKPSV
jgi:GH15 family glucan-1,4-alpha-glucosidase